MSTGTASLLGVTGMTGHYLLQLLLDEGHYNTIRVIVRRPFEKHDARVEVKLVDFSDAESLRLALEGSDCIFCCVGTTMKRVKGDRQQYRKIDFDIPVQSARWGKAGGCETFVVMSSVGASEQSGNFYLRLKGEMENAVQQQGLRSVHVMQPSMLLGDRKEKRRGERIAKLFMNIFGFLLIGKLKKYRPIHAGKVAAAMLEAGRKSAPGFHRYTYEEIRKCAAVK